MDHLVLACRNVVVAGVRCAGRGRKTWGECEQRHEIAYSGIHVETSYMGRTSNPSLACNRWTFYE